VPGAKERLLLAALAAGSPGVVSTDSLAETLWDGAPPVSARKSLQAHVVRLRSSLEPDRPKGSTGRYVVRRGTGYALSADRGVIDAVHMGELAARGHAELASGRPEHAADTLRRAVELWRGSRTPTGLRHPSPRRCGGSWNGTRPVSPGWRCRADPGDVASALRRGCDLAASGCRPVVAEPGRVIRGVEGGDRT
jgi:DNA-binding winged helix-turn-helix (wHTH) protein